MRKIYCYRLILLASAGLLLININLVQAQTRIFVQNDTPYDLSVAEVSVGGDKISKKAWKQGKNKIPSGERVSVLSIIRAGKVNWMDPTPRFIEPGKTAIFTTEIVPEEMVQAKPIALKQKLLGTGKSSKMWQLIEGAENEHQWQNDDREYQGIWQPKDSQFIKFSYRAYPEKQETHVEYIFSSKD